MGGVELSSTGCVQVLAGGYTELGLGWSPCGSMIQELWARALEGQITSTQGILCLHVNTANLPEAKGGEGRVEGVHVCMYAPSVHV